MGVTIKDVAKRAGVSHTTVSMVLHNDKTISQKTREKVLRAIKEINYHPNYFARVLIQGKTNIIAVVTSYFFFSSFFELNTFSGIEDSNKNYHRFKDKYMINLFSTGGEKKDLDNLLNAILYGKRADAVIILNMRPSKTILKDFKERKVPIVLIDEMARGAHVVKTDNFEGAFLATEYLIKRDRKKICIILGNERTLSIKERLEGYREALRKYKIKFDPDKILKVKDYTFEGGIKILDEILRKNVDSVFCAAGDIVAMGIIKGAKLKNIKIPEELAVIGYDDIFPASLSEPPLTTIRQPAKELGMEALNIAADALEGRIEREKTVVFKPELIIRDSTP